MLTALGLAWLVSLATPVTYDGLLDRDRGVLAVVGVAAAITALIFGPLEGLAIRAGRPWAAAAVVLAHTPFALLAPTFMCGRLPEAILPTSSATMASGLCGWLLAVALVMTVATLVSGLWRRVDADMPMHVQRC